MLSPESESENRDRFSAHEPRAPAVAIALALSAGVLADRYASGIAWERWIVAAAACAGAGVALSRIHSKAAAWIAVFGLWFCLGGARHHAVWSVASANDIRFFLQETPQIVRLRGVIASMPAIRPADGGPMQASWARIDRSQCQLDCRALASVDGETPVAGALMLSVDGHLRHVEVGDEVTVTGWLSRPMPPANPGEFEYDLWLRRRGMTGRVSADHPDAVVWTGRDATIGWRFRRLVARLRGEGEALFQQRLSRRTAPIASAILLGDRSGLTEDVRRSFSESGMAHVMAISGLHIGILAALIWPAIRFWNASAATSALTLALATAAYACLTDGGPPVVRAAFLLTTLAIAMPAHRAVSPVNALGIAAIGILLWKPTDLFDVGAQLSFLAVAGMIAIGRFRKRRRGDRTNDFPEERGLLAEGISRIASAIRESGWLMLGIWIATLPLVMARFHLVSPIGLLMNLALVPFVTLVLWAGYLFLFIGMLSAPASQPFAFAFDAGMSLFLHGVEWAAALPYGHFTAPPPADWWLVGYYLLAGGLFLLSGALWSRRLTGLLAVWVVFGLALGLRPPETHGLRCTFLAVGHGGAVLLELPNGATLLYDAGSLQSPSRAERAVQAALWSRGRNRLDAIVISHADIDHFNGVPGIMKSVPVGRLFVARSFLDFGQPPVRETCEAAFARGVPIRLVREGDRLIVDEAVEIRVLHPPEGQWTAVTPSDNASSVVLEVTYAGRRVLLTGDLEREGLHRLLTLPSRPIDVMLSPHHGSLAANPAALGTWAKPATVVASGGTRIDRKTLSRNYGDQTRVLTTATSGAVTIEIAPDGLLTSRTAFVDSERPNP